MNEVIPTKETPITTVVTAKRNLQINFADPYIVVGQTIILKKDLANEVATATTNANCVLMKNHGALTVGENILEAFDRLEVLENAAKMTLMTLGPLKGHVNPINTLMPH